MPLKVDTDTVAILGILDSTTGEYIKYDMVKELEVNEYKLEEQMSTQASKYAYYSSIANVAERNERAKTDALEVAEAQAEITARSMFASQGVAKPTVGQINSAISLDTTVIEAKKQVSEAKGYTGTMKYILKALDQRKDMLVNLSAQKRKSLELTGRPQ